MIPGMNPRDLAKAMKKMGIKQEEIDAEEVIIKGSEKNIIIRNPSVVRVNAMGQDSFQISGDVEEQEPTDTISEEDIKTVAAQANVSEEKAKKALEGASGDLAKAILSFQE